MGRRLPYPHRMDSRSQGGQDQVLEALPDATHLRLDDARSGRTFNVGSQADGQFEPDDYHPRLCAMDA